MPSQPPLFLATMLATLFVGTALFLLQTSYLDSLRGAARHQRDSHHDQSGSTWIRRKVKLLNDDKVDIYAHPIGKLIPVQCWKFPHLTTLPSTDCFRMAAPLDYNNASDHRRASIALLRYKAGGGKTPRDQVLGTVFINTGGPGGSGVQDLQDQGYGGTTFAEAFDSLLDRRYDIVGPDPRGVGLTRPQANCIPSTEIDFLWLTFSAGDDLYHASSGALPRQIADARYLAEYCYREQGEELRYVTTTATARDFHLLYKAFGDEKLNYLGFSYGTALGAYLADMFPQDVGRFFLTGVLNSHYWKLGSPGDDLSSFETSLDEFFHGCVRAGQQLCALESLLTKEELRLSRAKQANILKGKFYDKIEALRIQPEPVMYSQNDQIATYAALKVSITIVLSAPEAWPSFAALLAQALQTDDWTNFYASFGMVGSIPRKLSKKEEAEYRKFYGRDANQAIMCSDSLIHSQPVSVKSMEALIHHSEKQSPYYAEIRHAEGEQCRTAWKIVGQDRWDGDFNSKTANSILWGSMESDYITPLNQARNMSASFPGSRLLVMKGGYGHSTLAMPSRCATKVIRSHFLGKLAEGEDEIICHPDRKPYEVEGQKSEDELLARGEEAELHQVGQDLSRVWTGHHVQKMRQRKWGRGYRNIF